MNINSKLIMASTIVVIASLIGVGPIGLSNLNAYATSATTSSSMILLNSGANTINASATAAAPQYIGLAQANVNYADDRVIVPLNGTLSNLFVHIVRQTTTQTSGAAWTFTVVKTNPLTSTALTCSTPLTGPTGNGGTTDILVSCNDKTHSVSVTAGDMIVVSAVANSPTDHYTRATVGIAFTPQ